MTTIRQRWQAVILTCLVALCACASQPVYAAGTGVRVRSVAHRDQGALRPNPGALLAARQPGGVASRSVALGSGSVERTLAEAGKPQQRGEWSKIKQPKLDFSRLLKNPKLLGFTPTKTLFRNVYYYIKQGYVDRVSDQHLFNGVKHDVRILLTQAKVNPSGLKTLNPKKQVLPQLLSLYGNKVNRNLLTFTAITGMLDSLHDPYSLLLTPKEYGKLEEQMQSKDFGGIGIYIDLDHNHGNRLTVFQPIKGTPAYKAGLEAGDQIMKINGKSTRGITLDMAQAAIRGPVGTPVVLAIHRADHPKLLSFSITRGLIHVISVSSKMLPHKIGYVRLRMFGQDTSQELRKALTRLKSQGMKGLILDLRNNGGGYIDTAVSVVGQFLHQPNGLVVYTIDRNKRRRDYRATTTSDLHIPMVCMINRFSASASEITSGALRDHKIATLVGEHSFGKGSVQQLYPFPDGAALKLTIAKFFTPDGHVINHRGLQPKYALKMAPRLVGVKGKDTQLKLAIQVLRRKMAAANS